MIYWFKTKNPATGKANEDSTFDTNEKSAYFYLQSPKAYEYVGASKGNFIQETRVVMEQVANLPKATTPEQRETILEARQKEIDSADASIRPRNFSKTDVSGNPIKDYGQLQSGLIR